MGFINHNDWPGVTETVFSSLRSSTPTKHTLDERLMKIVYHNFLCGQFLTVISFLFVTRTIASLVLTYQF